jgi:hypothetical protein
MPVHKLWSNYRLLDTWNDWLSVVTFAHLAWSATLKLWQVMKEIWLARTWQGTQVRVRWSIDMNVFIILMSMMGVIRDIECGKARYCSTVRQMKCKWKELHSTEIRSIFCTSCILYIYRSGRCIYNISINTRAWAMTATLKTIILSTNKDEISCYFILLIPFVSGHRTTRTQRIRGDFVLIADDKR